MKEILSITFLITGCNLSLIAQSINGIEHQRNYFLHIHKISEKIELDGDLNETVWKYAEVATNFSNWTPQDIGKPKRETEVRITYNDQYLYIGITGYDTTYDIIKTLKRDAEIRTSDGIGIVLDPINERSNGFVFVLNTMNVQAEDVISPNSDNNWSWDNKWFSATKRFPDKWTMEIAIPFKTLRYSSDKKVWGINFTRSDLKNNEYSTWTKLTSNIGWLDLGFTGALIWDQPPPPPGKNISLIPYIKNSLLQDKENGKSLKAKINAGFDAKLAINSAMNLDLTVNPDFSEVEVDEQVTNLTRFDIFFPEKRTFFLENSDLFTDYGAPPIRPFYSRTIGLDKDGNPIPIAAGARLSGNASDKLRIGLMNIQTQRKNDFAAQNYTAVSFNQRVLKRSVIKGYFLNRQGFLNEQEKQQQPLEAFGRNTGTQFSYTDSKGQWIGQASYHLSFKPGISTHNTYYQFAGGFNSRKFSTFVAWDAVGTNYYTDMGFVERIYNYDAAKDSFFRQGFGQLFNANTYTIFPLKGNIATHVFQLNNVTVFNPDGTFNERNNEVDYTINFKNTSRFKISFISQQQNLTYSVKFVSNPIYRPLPPENYKFNSGGIEFNTDTRKLFNVFAGFKVGQFIMEIFSNTLPNLISGNSHGGIFL